jgi:hypothetical protein
MATGTLLEFVDPQAGMLGNFAIPLYQLRDAGNDLI